MKSFNDFLSEAMGAITGKTRTYAYWTFKTNLQGHKRRKLMCPQGYKSAGPLHSHCVPLSTSEMVKTRLVAFHSNMSKFQRHLGAAAGASYSQTAGLKRKLHLQRRHQLGLGSKLTTHNYGTE